MLLIEGPNHDLRRQLRERLLPRVRELHARLSDPFLTALEAGRVRVALSGVPGLGTTGAVTRLINADHLFEVRDGLPLRFPLDHAIWHLTGSALAVAGSVLVVAKRDEDDPLLPNYHPTITALTPFVERFDLWDAAHLPHVIKMVLLRWEKHLIEAKRYEKFGGSGHLGGLRTMVVGERVNPFRPTTMEGCPRAFSSNQGCSLFLHAALAAAGGEYYLTNAVKERSAGYNRDLLAQELELVHPAHVVAMGTEAARALSDLRVSFTQTYHPQYWKRFKNKDFPELVELLRTPDSITHNQPKHHGSKV